MTKRKDSAINIRRLQFFLALAKSGSFARAARLMGVSQPSISVQIATLEKELGALLFERHPRNLRLTEAGVKLKPAAQDIVRTIAALPALISADAAAALSPEQSAWRCGYDAALKEAAAAISRLRRAADQGRASGVDNEEKEFAAAD